MSPLLGLIGFVMLLSNVTAGIISDYGGHEFEGHHGSFETLGEHEHGGFEGYQHIGEEIGGGGGGGYEHGYLYGGHHELDDFDHKPIPGINHGKGVLSYSTTYQFLDPKH